MLPLFMKSSILWQGRITVIDLKVVGTSDRAPLGYLPLAHTHDDSELLTSPLQLVLIQLISTLDTKAFSAKVLTMKVGPNEQTTRAVTEIQILSASRKEDVPAGFKRLPLVLHILYMYHSMQGVVTAPPPPSIRDINGFSICYKVGDVGKRKAPQPAIQLTPETTTE